MTGSVAIGSELIKERLQELIPATSFYLHSFPILLLFIAAMTALLVGIFRSTPNKPSAPAVGIALVAISAMLILLFMPSLTWEHTYLRNAFIADNLTRYGFIVISAGLLCTIIMANAVNVGRMLLQPELLALLMFSAAGLMLVLSAGEFITFLIGLEIASIPLYVLVGFQRDQKYAFEAAIKYFLLGAVASALILMGMALIYLHTGSLTWQSFHSLHLTRQYPLAIVGAVLFFSGLAFKLALAPFHMWAPDVYEGANSLLTAFMISMVKVAVVITFIRILSAGIDDSEKYLSNFLWITGALSMIIGSLYGLVQNSVKRILAYSSIANAGYFTLGLIALAKNPTDALALQALVSYTGIYAILSFGSFGVLLWLEESGGENLSKTALCGLGKRNPFPALLLTIFLFGLAGIPPVAGFFGKLWLIYASLNAGFIGLTLILAIFGAISLFYYLNLIAYMWFYDAKTESNLGDLAKSHKNYLTRTLLFLAVISIIIGVFGPRWS